jgi:hypothetical protein
MNKVRMGALILVLCLFVGCRKDERAVLKKHTYKTSVVPEILAKKVAERLPPGYFHNREETQHTSTFYLPDRKIENSFIVRDENDISALYVYNYTDGGFVVISAEWQHEPICAFVETGRIVENDSVPATLVEWFGKTVENIELLRQGAYDNKNRALLAWCQLFDEAGLAKYPEVCKMKPADPPLADCNAGWTTTNAGPLLPVTWGQGCSYNENCPDRSCTNICLNNQHAWTGCVATAMAQVICYWQPKNPYNYDYTSMPLNAGNNEVQRLMLDAGHAVGMNYNCAGSFADGGRVSLALKGFPASPYYLPGFGFSSADRNSYTAGSYSILKDNLTRHWPVFLEGCAAKIKIWLFSWKYSECHEWVCDGFQSSQNNCYGYLWLHMNWGWHEAGAANDFNGWFAFNNWDIPGVNINFQYFTHYTYNVHP